MPRQCVVVAVWEEIYVCTPKCLLYNVHVLFTFFIVVVLQADLFLVLLT